MKVKVVSDGTPNGTHVMTEQGDIIGGIQWISIFISSDETQNNVMMELTGVPIEILANAQIYDNLPEVTEEEEVWINRKP